MSKDARIVEWLSDDKTLSPRANEIRKILRQGAELVLTESIKNRSKSETLSNIARTLEAIEAMKQESAGKIRTEIDEALEEWRKINRKLDVESNLSDVILVDFVTGETNRVKEGVSRKVGRETVKLWKDKKSVLVVVPTGWTLTASFDGKSGEKSIESF